MRSLIVTGGSIPNELVLKYMKEEKWDRFYAADAGLVFFYRNKLKPDVILGDFDSADQDALAFFRKQKEIRFQEFKPEKDETDTELALRTAIEEGAEEVVLFGATGTRLDHVLGNIGLLSMGLEAGIRCMIVDEHNRIRLTDGELTLKRTEQYGKYVSLIPLTATVKGITLTGFRYPLSDAELTSSNSLGISNEIAEETARITFEEGILIVIESAD